MRFSLARSFMTVGGLTMVSRVLGFVRDIMIAGLLGSGATAQAFFIAFRFPNLFRRLFAEGAFNIAFIPLFAKKLEGETEKDAHTFAQDAFSGLFSILFILVLLFTLAMPWAILMIAAGFADDPAKLDMTILFARIQFPYLLFISLVALLSGVLNSLGKFAMAAGAPVALNVILITVMSVATHMNWDIGLSLSWGVFASGIAQFALVYYAAVKAGIRLTLKRPRWTADIRRLVRLGIPGMLSGGVTQINLLIGTTVASFFGAAVVWLPLADRVYQLPLGVVGIAIGVVLLPELSRQLRANRMDSVNSSLNRSIEFALVLTLPAAVALVIVPEQIVSVLYERGAFLASDTQATSLVLALFALGLPAFVLQKVFSPAYYAQEDMKRPLKFAIYTMVVNAGISLIGLWFFKTQDLQYAYLAIPIGTTLAGWLNVILLWLGSKNLYVMDDRLIKRLPRLLGASLGMGGVLYGFSSITADYFADSLLRYPALAVLIIAGIISYGILCHFTGAFRLNELKTMVKRK